MSNVIPNHARRAVLERYRNWPPPGQEPKARDEWSYATVRDFCDSVDHLPGLVHQDSDLKDVQRPWALKAIVSRLRPGAQLCEIGGGEPLTAAALVELGYGVTVVDPYDGSGNGPVEYNQYRRQYPSVRFIRERFSATTVGLPEKGFDCVFSISTLEHIPEPGLTAVFDGIERFLRPSGWSIHCVDGVVEGRIEEYQRNLVKQILGHQRVLAGAAPDLQEYARLVERMKADLETYYLGPQGFHQWRFGRSYDQYPFLKIVSMQTCIQKRVSAPSATP